MAKIPFTSLLFCLFFLSARAFGFSVVSYNVQNLFDHQKTKGHRDYTYLAKSDPLKKKCSLEKSEYYRRYCKKLDWNEEKVEKRIELLKSVLKEVPKFPSLLGLVEIETKELALSLGKDFNLKKAVITTGSDERGIQNVLLFNPKIWKLLKSEEWSLPFATRNLLEVHLKHIEKKHDVVIFVNHWPSQRSPTAKRTQLAKLLLERVKKVSKKNLGIIALGDFNTLARENPHPFHQELFLKGKFKEAVFKRGTYFYGPKMSWNHLDRIFFQGPLKLIENKVIAPDFATDIYEYTDKGKDFWGSRVVGTPKRANPLRKKKLGYSDHFPVYAEFSWVNDK